MQSFGGKNVKTRFFGKNLSFSEFSTSSLGSGLLHACKQRGASD